MRSIFSTKKNLLGISNGEWLINTLWLCNSLHFGLRGCGEHRQMCWGDVQLMKDTDRTEYLYFSEKQTKTRSARCTLIRVMSDRSNLELSRLQIYRANEILLLFSRYFLKRDQSPWTNQMHPFILVLIILQKTLIKVGLKPMQWELTNLTVWWKQWLRSPALTTLTLRTTGLENGWSKAAGYGLELLYNVTWRDV